MTDLPYHPDSDEHTGAGPHRGSVTERPWGRYVLGIIAIALVLLFVVLHLTGTFGPGGH